MTERIINLDWTHVTVLFMLIFAYVGLKNGWQRGLVTLVSLFFAWGLALKTTDFLIAAIDFATDISFAGEMRGFFQIALYVAAVVMVVVTFNSKIVGGRPTDRRELLSGVSTGLLSGYFFVVLLLDLGRDWIADHVEDWNLVYNSAIQLDGRGTNTVINVNFTNNPYVAYDQLITAQSLILLFILLVFWHGLVFALLNRVDQRLRPSQG